MTRLHYSGYVWDGGGLRPATGPAVEVPGYGVREVRHQPLVLSGDEPRFTASMLALIAGGIGLIWYFGFREDRPRSNPGRKRSERELAYEHAARSRRLRGPKKVTRFSKARCIEPRRSKRRQGKRAPFTVSWQTRHKRDGKSHWSSHVASYTTKTAATSRAKSVARMRNTRRVVMREY